MKLKRLTAAVFAMLMCAVSACGCLAADTDSYDFSKKLSESEAEKTVTRGEFSHYLAHLLNTKGVKTSFDNEDTFKDIQGDYLYNDDIMYLKKLSVVTGVGGGDFRPNDNITYEEAATMISRVFLPDFEIAEKYGEYPTGYIKYALKMGLLRNIRAIVAQDMKMKDLYTVMNNLESEFVTYDLMEKLGCDAYNGKVYIDYYPKSWQGFEEKPIATTNGYFKILPARLLYSYDKENWNVLYEDIDGKRKYSNLPKGVDITGARYAWEDSCFVNAPFDKNKKYYSYDNKEWFKGSPEQGGFPTPKLNTDSFAMGIKRESILFDKESGLYFSWQPYYEQPYYSNRYETVFSDIRCNIVWASEDAVQWIGISIPEDMLFFTGAGMNDKAKALIIDGAVNFTDEEKAFLDNEEKTAAEKGLGYDKPRYKPETYMLRFSEVKKLFKE